MIETPSKLKSEDDNLVQFDKMGDKIAEIDKMGDVINPMNSSNSEDEGMELAPIKGMCYESLSEHYKTHCKNVEIQCTSCD